MKDAPQACTLAEMVAAMSKYRDDEIFRWYQCSILDAAGAAQPTVTLFVTMGQVRRELGLNR